MGDEFLSTTYLVLQTPSYLFINSNTTQAWYILLDDSHK